MSDLESIPDDDFAQDDPTCANCGELEEDCDCEDGFEPEEGDEGDEDDEDDEDDDFDEDDEDEEDV